MGLFDRLLGKSIPEEAQSKNLALQKEANKLEEKSKDINHRSHCTNPFSRQNVHETVNEFRAHQKRLENFKDQPGYDDFRTEPDNKKFVERLSGRDKWTETELGVKSAVSSWDLKFNSGVITGSTREDVSSSCDKQ